MRVAFQGEPGAYSEEAVRAYFGGGAQPVGLPTFAEVFASVRRGEVERALVPVENSLAGVVAEPHDLLLSSGLQVVGEHFLRVRHCLLAREGERLETLTEVRSHPQALAQCQQFLDRHRLAATPADDTAGSARRLREGRWPHVGVIASERAASHYGLSILARDLETSPDNTTRFVEVAAQGGQSPGALAALGVLPAGGAAGLGQTLALLGARGLTLCRLVARPSGEAPFLAVYYLEVLADRAAAEGAVQALRAAGDRVTVLGVFPRASR